MAKQKRTARAAALTMLLEVTENKRLLTELLPKAVSDLEPKDRARAQRLATDTLRWADRADRMLGPYLRNKPEDTVLNALRLGVFELAESGADAHGVVNDLVAWIKTTDSWSKSGLVNAVLRNVVGDLDKWEALPAPKLPKWLQKPIRQAYGKDVLGMIEIAHAAGAPLDLTAKKAPQEWADKLDGTALPSGSVRLNARQQVTGLAGFETGDWWIQDAAAALPAQILATKAGEKVLDLCAAPGGKTMQLAATGASVTALDDSETRAARITENLTRTGLDAKIVISDALEWIPTQLFDAVLLDAPCSATGTIRRHPDLPYAKSWQDIEPLFELQAELLDRAAAFLRPGGRLVYCTCSLLPEEGEHQIAKILDQNKRLSLDLDALKIPGVLPDWVGEFGLRLRPDYMADQGGMDGFFICALQKAA